MKLIKENENTIEVMCNLCKKKYIINKSACVKTKEGYEILGGFICKECKSKDSNIIDYNKMLSIYNVTEKRKNIKAHQKQLEREKCNKQYKINTCEIKCPNCNSVNVRRITKANKAISAAILGFFSIGKLTNSYECNNCKYRW